MKKLFILIMAIVFVAGCATVDPRVTALEEKVSKLERKIIMGQATGAGANMYPVTGGLTGGGTGTLDKIASPAIGDVAFVVMSENSLYGNSMFVYTYTDFGAAVSENSPYEIKPDTGSSANYAWALAAGSNAPPVVVTSARSLTLGEVRNGMVMLTTVDTVTLPAAAVAGYGTMLCIYARDAEVATVDLDGSEKFFIAGAAKAAGATITSDGVAGDFACMVAVTDIGDGSTDGWWVFGMGATPWQ